MWASRRALRLSAALRIREARAFSSAHVKGSVVAARRRTRQLHGCRTSSLQPWTMGTLLTDWDRPPHTAPWLIGGSVPCGLHVLGLSGVLAQPAILAMHVLLR